MSSTATIRYRIKKEIYLNLSSEGNRQGKYLLLHPDLISRLTMRVRTFSRLRIPPLPWVQSPCCYTSYANSFRLSASSPSPTSSIWYVILPLCLAQNSTNMFYFRLLMEIISFCLGHDVHIRSARNMGIFQVQRQSCRDWRRRRRTCHQDMGLRSPTNFQ